MPGSNGSEIPNPVSPALRTLGGAALLDAATGATLLGPGKPLALVAYLALNPGHAATREFLTDLLWADLEADSARHALRQALWQLRHVLGEASFAGRDELRLALPIASDRDGFLSALEQGEYDLAVERYTGSFLPDLAVPGGVEFEHWADLERDRLRAMFLRACEMATRRKLAASQFRDAQRIARRARDADPGNELGWRLLLESLAAGQDFITATLEADALEARAVAEQRELEPATRAMVRIARQVSEAAPRREPALVADLIGREREYAIILDAWERAQRGPATHVHLSAPAGLGKTRLLHDVHARLAAAGKRVVSVRAHPGERQIPCALASELAGAVSRLPGVVGISPASAGALVGLNPALSSRFNAAADSASGDDALRNRTIALTEALMAAAEEAPFALLIDDLHWADAGSRQLLDGVLARLDGARVAVVTASRPGRDALPSIDTTTTLALPPLTEAQVGSFVTSLGALPPGEPWAKGIERGLHLATSGSPLLMLQLLKLALEREAVSLDEAGWHCPDAEALGRMLREGEALRNRLDALPREHRWLVTTLAIAGIPLETAALAAAAGRDVDAVRPDLEELERLGLVSRIATSWDLAHDEIGAVASENLTDTAAHTAHRGLGAALMAAAATDPVLLMRAARHLAVPGDIAGLVRCARSYVRALRLRGDGRSPTALVTELLGPGATPELRLAVNAGLPLRWRLGLWGRTRMAVAGGVAGLVVITALTRLLAPAHPGPTMELVLFTRGDSAITAGSTPVSLAEWDPQEPLHPIDATQLARGIPRDATMPRYSPDGARLLVSARTGEVTTDDVLLIERGRLRQLTREPRDDLHATWSPDGRWIVFLTARWSPEGADDYDLAILDPETGSVRQLTRTRDWDLGMSWSPDGSRIAFGRHFRELRPGQLCVIPFDGLEERCTELPGLDVSGPIGWLDPGTVVVAAERMEDKVVAAYDLESGRVTPLLQGNVQQALLSPDGNWLWCQCSRGGDEPPGSWIMPSGSPIPAQMRKVESGEATATPAWRALVALPTLDTLVLPDVRMPLDGSASPEVIPRDSEGRRMAIPRGALRWAVSDTSVATIDPGTGHITPRTAGMTRVSVTAGGWRSTTAALVVAPPAARLVLVDSTWDDLDPLPASQGTWRLYGTPLPRRVDSAGGAAISNGGDGIYSSGIYSRAVFPVQDGLGIEAEISVPLTRAQWQGQAVVLQSDRAIVFDGWDHRSGGPQPTAYINEQCSASYPAGEGSTGPKLHAFAASGTGKKVAVKAPYEDGRWFRVRVQLFSDGTCGFAIDGEPRWRGSTRLPLDRPWRAMLGGNSAGTTVRIRKVEMWVGVRGDVKW